MNDLQDEPIRVLEEKVCTKIYALTSILTSDSQVATFRIEREGRIQSIDILTPLHTTDLVIKRIDRRPQIPVVRLNLFESGDYTSRLSRHNRDSSSSDAAHLPTHLKAEIMQNGTKRDVYTIASRYPWTLGLQSAPEVRVFVSTLPASYLTGAPGVVLEFDTRTGWNDVRSP